MTGIQGGPAQDDRNRGGGSGDDPAAEGGKPSPGDRGEAGPAGEPGPIDLDAVRDRAS